MNASVTKLPTQLGAIHFVGIGGIGMSGIAEVLLNHGYEVQGSDLKASKITDRLTELGARIFIGPLHAESAVAVAVEKDDDRASRRGTGGAQEAGPSGCPEQRGSDRRDSHRHQRSSAESSRPRQLQHSQNGDAFGRSGYLQQQPRLIRLL